MKIRLQNKLQETSKYNREELDWLLARLGDKDPSIRDHLVYASFGHGLLGSLITKDDYLYMARYLLDKDYLFYRLPNGGISTLTRSFTALLLALIIGVDATKESDYYALLSPAMRQKIFDGSLLYLRKETDDRGWDETVGWVHAFAHGCELLLYASMHPDFPADGHQKIWEVMVFCIEKQSVAFSAGEEKRMAWVIVQKILKGHLSQQDLTYLIKKWNFVDQSTPDFFSALNRESFLMTLYFLLKKEGKLQTELAQVIEELWTGVS